MVAESIVIKHPLGLHLRPAGDLCTAAMDFKSLIELHKENCTVNAKSLLSLLGACVRCDDEITITCTGSDEEEALAAVMACLQRINKKAEQQQ